MFKIIDRLEPISKPGYLRHSGKPKARPESKRGLETLDKQE